MSTDETDPVTWEYTIVHTDRLTAPGGPQLAHIWRRKYTDGSTDWDQVNSLGADGWEMVNAFPVESGGSLQYVGFVFKRRKRPSNTAAGQDQATLDETAPGTAAPDQPQMDQNSPLGRQSTNA